MEAKPIQAMRVRGRNVPTSNDELRLSELVTVLNRPAVIKQRVLAHAARWRLPLTDDGGMGFWIAVYRVRAQLDGVEPQYQAASRQWLRANGYGALPEAQEPSEEGATDGSSGS